MMTHWANADGYRFGCGPMYLKSGPSKATRITVISKGFYSAPVGLLPLGRSLGGKRALGQFNEGAQDEGRGPTAPALFMPTGFPRMASIGN